MRYLTFPISTDPEELVQAAISYIQDKFPGWRPNDGNIDTILIEAISHSAADLRYLASAVPDTIFRYYGNSLVMIQPVGASPAQTTTTWTAIDNSGYTIPAGTQVGIRNSLGEIIPFVTIGDVTIPPGSVSTAAGEVPIVALVEGEAGSGLGGVGAAVELIDLLAWVNTVVATGMTTGGIDAETDDAYLDRLRTELSILTPRPILPHDFSILARRIAGVWRATTVDGYNPFHNILTANQASIETDASGWATDTNVTIAQSATQVLSGTFSLRLRSVAAGDMAARTTPTNQAGLAVVPGDHIVGIASFRAGATGRNVRVDLEWRDSGGTLLSRTNGATVADLTTGWVQASVTGIAPSLAAFVTLRAYVVGTTAANEDHFVDQASIRRGSTTDWVPGGTAATNVERMVTVFVHDEIGNALSNTVKTAVQVFLDAMREVNFVVNVLDPTYTSIDVTYIVHPRTDAPSTLIADINTAIAAYLNPATWGMSLDGDVHEWENVDTVRYLELAQVINAVQGVDYIVSLDFGRTGGTIDKTDKKLAGPAGLPVPGTQSGSTA